jgi:iron complex outermembrane receptor protein
MNFKHFIFFLTFIFTSAFGDEDLSLRDIYVITDVITPGDISSGQTLSSSKLNTQFQRDTSSLLETFTGIHSANNGSVSSIPYMHGFNDDRIRISVDGVDLNSACTSHSDTDLSFVNIDDVDFVKVFAGITPVSMGGDSIAGTIKIKTKKPKFNSTQEWSESANIKSFYKSNSDEQGVNIKTNLVTDTAYIQYSGTYSQANNYSSASSFKSESYGGSSDKPSIGNDEVGSSGYRMENHQLSYGYQLENHLLELKLDYQNMPYQGFVNQRMDVIGQNSHKINLTDTINFSWGVVELQAYHHQVETKMNFGKNKNFIYQMELLRGCR